METLPWIAAVRGAVAARRSSLRSWIWLPRRPQRPRRCPTEWALSARPVFSTDERRVYKLLREALPHHIVLSKLPLVRFCQPTDPRRSALLVRPARRDQRHLRGLQRQRPGAGGDRSRHRPRQFAPHPADQAIGARRLPHPLPALPGRPPAVGRPSCSCWCRAARRHGARTAARPRAAARPRRRARLARQHRRHAAARSARALWQDSSGFQDSFFAPDSRADALGNSEFGIAPSAHSRAAVARTAPATHEPAAAALNGRDTADSGDDGDERAASSSIRRPWPRGRRARTTEPPRRRRAIACTMTQTSADAPRDPHPTPTSRPAACSTRSTRSACAATAGCSS